jgi:hypothetical protein
MFFTRQSNLFEDLSNRLEDEISLFGLNIMDQYLYSSMTFANIWVFPGDVVIGVWRLVK